MAAIIQINSGTGGVSNDNLPLDTVVTLTSVNTALYSYTWAIVSQPEGPLDAIVGSGQIVTFTPTKEGSYLVKLTVDFGYPSEDSQQLIAAVRELETGDRIPAIGETVENSVNDGWANPVDAILQRVTRFTDAGVQPGAAAEALAVGDVVYASDTYTLAAGLPGERVVAKWSKAHADVIAEVQGVFGIVAGSVLGGSIATDDVITVQTTGLYQGVPFASAPAVGDPVFISDAAGLSLTQGTIKRQIGTVCDVGASTYAVMVGPAPAEIDAPAGGDLSGTYPDPTVVGLQGKPISATAPTSGQVLKWSGAAWAPAADSTTPSGSAGGVLGYTGSTYPNPNGLAPVSGSVIPVAGAAGTVTVFQADNVSSLTKSPGIALYAGQNASSGDGGDALLVGGTVSTGGGGIARSSGGDGGTLGGSAELRAGASSDALGASVVANGGYTTTGGSVEATGGAGDEGGAVTVSGGIGYVGAGGTVLLQGGSGANDGGSAYLNGGIGTTGAGGNASIAAGDGLVGGAVSITSGDGSGGAAGGINIAAGDGTTVGGAVLIAAGASGAGFGSVATLTGGSGSTAGGTAGIQGGAGGTGNGGAAIVIGGDSSSGGNGGSAALDAGMGATNGNVVVGTIRAEQVSVGRSGKDVLTNGRNVGVPTTYAPLAATTIPVNGPTIFLNPAANRDMTASPTLQTSGITAGTIVTLVNNDSTFYVDLTQDAGGTSYLKLATGNIYLFKYDSITFIFDGTYWVEVGRNVQPGKSYTPVAGTTIPFLCPSILLANAGAVNLGTANTTIQTLGVNAGSRITFVQKGAGTTTFSRGGSSALKLTNPSHALAQYATLELVFDGTFWCELSQSNNA